MEAVTTVDNRTLLAALSEVFALLSEVYLEPEADARGRAADLVGRCPQACEGLEGLPGALRGMTEHGGSAQDQAVEYVRLFIQGRSSATVHPYESVYTHGRLMDPGCLGDLWALHKAAGLRPRPEIHLPPDHLGLELGFLAYLLAQMAQEGHDGDPPWRHLAEDLLRRHLIPFSRQFVGKLREAGPSPFYRSAGEALVEGLHACTLLMDLPTGEAPSPRGA